MSFMITQRCRWVHHREGNHCLHIFTFILITFSYSNISNVIIFKHSDLSFNPLRSFHLTLSNILDVNLHQHFQSLSSHQDARTKLKPLLIQSFRPEFKLISHQFSVWQTEQIPRDLPHPNFQYPFMFWYIWTFICTKLRTPIFSWNAKTETLIKDSFSLIKFNDFLVPLPGSSFYHLTSQQVSELTWCSFCREVKRLRKCKRRQTPRWKWARCSVIIKYFPSSVILQSIASQILSLNILFCRPTTSILELPRECASSPAWKTRLRLL